VASVTIGSPGAGGLKVSDLRIKFSVKKDDGKDTNSASIDIFNLSPESRKLIDDIDELVFLSAGYRDGNGEESVFIGNISNITHLREPPEIVTRIEAQDGAKEILEKKTALSFDAGISGREVLRKALQAFSIPNNLNILSFTDKSYAHGFSFSGSASKALDKITKFLDLEWSIQSNEIRIIPFDGNDGSRAALISPLTGMIGSPQEHKFSELKAKGKSKTNKKPGWKVESLLQPKIVPGGKVYLESREIPKNSLFTVVNVKHTGDTHSGDWKTVMEVKE
jgi:hypothetical protein